MTIESPDRPAADRPAASRPAEARLARLHLRTGMLSLARAELETMAADGTLDTPALADLAEARWRSGDLPGAGDAAVAHLDAGGAEPVALIVAAEALAARGRTNEARGYANRLLAMLPAGTADPLEPLFAGQPRSAAWPATDVEVGEAAAAGMVGFSTGAVPRSTARDQVQVVEAAIAAGDRRGVAVRLGIILRDEAALAPLVLSLADRAIATGDRLGAGAAALQLVRGDAFRAMGREIEASAAYQRARQAVEGPSSREGES